jgi:hypothetical protein
LGICAGFIMISYSRNHAENAKKVDLRYRGLSWLTSNSSDYSLTDSFSIVRCTQFLQYATLTHRYIYALTLLPFQFCVTFLPTSAKANGWLLLQYNSVRPSVCQKRETAWVAWKRCQLVYTATFCMGQLPTVHDDPFSPTFGSLRSTARRFSSSMLIADYEINNMVLNSGVEKQCIARCDKHRPHLGTHRGRLRHFVAQ